MKQKRAVTLVELMVVITIIAIVAAVASSSTGTTLRRNQMINQLRWVKTSFVTARGKAIEFTAPVRFNLNLGNNAILVTRDLDRDGDFAPEIMVLGQDLDNDQGVISPYDKILAIDPNGEGIASPSHWSGLASQGNVQPFPSDEIVVLPDGRVFAGNPLTPRSGTFYFKSNNDDIYGLVHITSMGEVKVATTYAKGDANAWSWKD